MESYLQTYNSHPLSSTLYVIGIDHHLILLHHLQVYSLMDSYLETHNTLSTTLNVIGISP